MPRQLKAVPAACNTPHRAALEGVRVELKARFLERNDIVDGLLAALLCCEHVLLLGPPGTAKSALAERKKRYICSVPFESPILLPAK